jgi:hypothetical protein
VKTTIPFWRNLTEKEKTNLLRRAFFHTVVITKRSVAKHKLEEIEKYDFMKTARRRFARSLHDRVNIPKNAKLFLEGKVVAKRPNGKLLRNLKRLRKDCTIEVTLQRVGCRVKSSAVKNQVGTYGRYGEAQVYIRLRHTGESALACCKIGEKWCLFVFRGLSMGKALLSIGLARAAQILSPTNRPRVAYQTSSY